MTRKTAPNRRERDQQASHGGCATDARLTRVSCQRGQNLPRDLNGVQPFGIRRARTDGLWQYWIAVSSKHKQSYEPKQDILRCQNT